MNKNKEIIKEFVNKWWKEKVIKSDAFVLPEKHQRLGEWDYERDILKALLTL